VHHDTNQESIWYSAEISSEEEYKGILSCSEQYSYRQVVTHSELSANNINYNTLGQCINFVHSIVRGEYMYMHRC
jgi:hypothetical protein